MLIPAETQSFLFFFFSKWSFWLPGKCDALIHDYAQLWAKCVRRHSFFTLFWHLCVIIFHHVKLLPIWEIKITSIIIIITTIFFPLFSPKLCGVLISKNTNNPILGFKRWNCSHWQHGGKSHKLLSVVRIRVKTTLFFFSHLCFSSNIISMSNSASRQFILAFVRWTLFFRCPSCDSTTYSRLQTE